MEYCENAISTPKILSRAIRQPFVLQPLGRAVLVLAKALLDLVDAGKLEERLAAQRRRERGVMGERGLRSSSGGASPSAAHMGLCPLGQTTKTEYRHLNAHNGPDLV